MTTSKRHRNLPPEIDTLFASGGEMGALMATIDWPATPIGPVEQWPPSLRIALGICLTSRFPVLLFWGEEMVKLYNDAYRTMLGTEKHPMAIGRRGAEVWSEIWHIIGPMLEGVLTSGEATWSEDQLLFMNRSGYMEETYFTFSYSPIRDEGGVRGIIDIATETTSSVLSDRRTRCLREVMTITSGARDVEDACQGVAAVLSSSELDVPWSLIYLIEPGDSTLRIVASSGVDACHAVSPEQVTFNGDEAETVEWPFADVLQGGEPRLVNDLSTRFAQVPAGPWPEPPGSAQILPITQPGTGQSVGVLVAAISARRAFDDDYHRFFDVIASNLSSAVARARAYEEEHRRVQELTEIRSRALQVEHAARVEAEMNETRYRALFNGSADAIVTFDLEGRILDSNPAAEILLGYSADELRAIPVAAGQLSTLDPDTSKQLFREVKKAGSRRMELELRRNDGSLVPVDSHVRALGLPGGTVYLATMRDISERKTIERLQNEFFAMVTHDLRSPLTSLKGFAQLMRMRGAYDDESMEIIVNQSEVLERLVDDLLTAARLDAEHLDLTPGQFDLVQVAQQTVDLAVVSTMNHKIRVDAPEGSVEGCWDQDRVAQVIQNLLSNAVKYSPDGGDVIVSVTSANSLARVSVRDRGIGIAPELTNQIFDRFYRVKNRESGPAGIGLGLYISKVLVEAHGGRIWAEPAPEGGSVFTFTLPHDNR